MPNHFHLVIETPAPNLVAGRKWLLGEHGIPMDTEGGRRYFVAAMEARRQGEQVQAFKAVRRGWCLGNKAFRKELLAQMKSRPGPNDYGEERYESDEARAEELLAVELKRRGWKPQDLLTRRKGDKGKGPDRGAAPAGHHDDIEMAGGTVGDGQRKLRLQPPRRPTAAPNDDSNRQKCKKWEPTRL